MLTCYGPLPLSFNGFEAAVSAACGRVANALFVACRSSALGGVWPFRIRCQRASFLSLRRLGCATFFARLRRSFLVSFHGFEGAVSAPCGRVANAPFLACLSSDFGGVWPFRIRCRRASFVCLCPGQVVPRFLSIYCGPFTCLLVFTCLLTFEKVQFQHRVEGLRTHRYWLA